MDAAVDKREKATTARTHWENKKAAELGTLGGLEEAAKILEDEFKVAISSLTGNSSNSASVVSQEWTTKAEDYAERVPNPRSVDKLKREKAALENSLKDRERR